jgi:hypothetical protein
LAGASQIEWRPKSTTIKLAQNLNAEVQVARVVHRIDNRATS